MLPERPSDRTGIFTREENSAANHDKPHNAAQAPKAKQAASCPDNASGAKSGPRFQRLARRLAQAA